MVADIAMVKAKLAELETYTEELKLLQKYSREELEHNLSNLWSVTHGLQLAIQISLDIGNHLLSDLGIKATDYTEIIVKLGEAGIIPIKFAQRIRGMAGFRNLLVHGYSAINVAMVYNTLQNNLDDFLKFAYYINRYID